MRYTAAEQREFEIDDLLGASLRTEVTDVVFVHLTDEERDLLSTEHASSWRVVTGSITASIVVVLALGPFHIAWNVAADEEAHVGRLLRTGQPLTLTLQSPRRPVFHLTIPALPPELYPQLTANYRPVNAA